MGTQTSWRNQVDTREGMTNLDITKNEATYYMSYDFLQDNT